MRALRARRRGEDAALTEAPSVRGRRPLAPLVRLVDGCESGAREGGEAEVVAEACVKQVPSRFREGSEGGAPGEAAARSRYRRHVTSRRRGRGRAGLQEGSEKVHAGGGGPWARGRGRAVAVGERAEGGEVDGAHEPVPSPHGGAGRLCGETGCARRGAECERAQAMHRADFAR